MTNPITEYNGKRIADMGDGELVSAYAHLHEIPAFQFDRFPKGTLQALRDAILLRMSQPKWVKVTPETMPLPSLDYTQRFEVYINGVGVEIAEYGKTIGGKWAFWREKKMDGRYNKRLFPSHYRELPEPPKESL